MALGLLSLLARLALPVLVIAAVLYPAYKIAGGVRKGLAAYAAWCIAVAIVWSLAGLFGVMPFFAASQASGPVTQLASLFTAAWGSPFLAGGMALLGVIFSVMAVLPGVIPRMAIAGGAMAVVVLGVSVLPWAWARALAGPLILVLWVVLPPAIFYSRALRRRATLRRYMRGECPACRTPGSIATGRCTSCGAAGQLCYRCRRFSKRPPGQTCVYCDATLGKRCWRCQFPLDDITGPRCPECGVWRAREQL